MILSVNSKDFSYDIVVEKGCLLNAKDYLAQGGYSITEIAEKCGFLSVNYFSRFFKKHTGVSPKQYAKF